MKDVSTSFSNIEKPLSLKDIAFREIKASILDIKLKPGNFYSEQAIATGLGISKTPVHEALCDLEARGFVIVIPRKGFKINVLGKEDVKDLFEFRHALEKAVILHITPKFDDNSIREVEDILNQTRMAQDRINFQKLDRKFHHYLSTLTKNRFIIDSLNNIWDLYDWVGTEILLIHGRSKETLNEHITIFEMLNSRNINGALQAMEEHLRISESRFIARMSTVTITEIDGK